VGQTIQINKTAVIDEVLVVDTDRSLTGQDGEAFSGRESARSQSTVPARLAVHLFDSDPAIDHVFVMSNTVSVRRLPAWSSPDVDSAVGVIAAFFRFYP
jgi:hypothetical protein